MPVKKPYGYLLLLLVLGACNLHKKLEPNQYLLQKNSIQISPTTNIDASKLHTIIKQRPNRKILGLFRANLWAYQFGQNFKEGKIKTLLTEKLGEAPVLLDSNLCKKSAAQLALYCSKKGYFNTKADYGVTVHSRKKRAIVHYILTLQKPYIVKQVELEANVKGDSLLYNIIQSNREDLLRKGAIFDVEVLDKERIRFSKTMQNKGYYFFQPNHISFLVDSNSYDNKNLKIKKIIKNPINTSNDSLNEAQHQRFKIQNIYIEVDPNPFETENYIYTQINQYHFQWNKSKKYNADILLKNIFIKPGQYYSSDQTDFSYYRLISLKVFRKIQIEYEPVEGDSTSGFMNCRIKLYSVPKQFIAIETDGTNRSGNLGLNLKSNYQNKNIFRGAEILQLNGNLGFEAQKTIGGDRQIENKDNAPLTGIASIFNTFESGIKTSLEFPSIIWPKSLTPFKKIYQPKTSIALYYQYQQRRNFYESKTLGASFAYLWSTKEENQFSYSPLDISSVKINTESEFQDRLDSLNNPFLNNTYSNHLIFASKLSYIFTDQVANKQKNFKYFKVSLESAGNLLRMYSKLSNSQSDSLDSYQLLGIRYAHYVKVDGLLTLFYVINKNSSLVYHFFSGLGFPQKNFPTLPFEKSFFGGGANGIRAWQARNLGPGSYSDQSATSFDKIGDIKLEGSIEYRFKVIKMLEGAVFADAGNIWLLNKDQARPGGNFQLSSFANDIAIGAGIGARLDLSFFIFRLDWGLQVRDPSLDTGEKWIYQNKPNYESSSGDIFRPKSNLNIAIGYPF